MSVTHLDASEAEILAALSRSRFRSGFHLRQEERDYCACKGMPAIEGECEALLVRHVASPADGRDGRQTPMRGHPLFIAQHAMALCCRGCIAKWYGIDPNRPLTHPELSRMRHLAMNFILREMSQKRDSDRPEQGELF